VSERAKQYYQANKAAIAAKRKARYDSDPEYRTAGLSASQRSRAARREATKEFRAMRVKRFRGPISGITADGTPITLKSVGEMAVYVGRTIQSITHWHQRGIIPETPYRDSRGSRFYTVAMMDVVKEEIAWKRRLFPPDPDMWKRVREAWMRLGVPVDYSGRDILVAIRRTNGGK